MVADKTPDPAQLEALALLGDARAQLDGALEDLDQARSVRRSRIIRARAAGLPFTRIGEALGISDVAVLKIARGDGK